jgi:hypothetical protein
MTTEEESKPKDRSFLRFVIVSTLIVIGMALCIFSPWIFLVMVVNIGLRGEFLNYIAFATYWSFFMIIVLLAAAIDWVRKRKKTE